MKKILLVVMFIIAVILVADEQIWLNPDDPVIDYKINFGDEPDAGEFVSINSDTAFTSRIETNVVDKLVGPIYGNKMIYKDFGMQLEPINDYQNEMIRTTTIVKIYYFEFTWRNKLRTVTDVEVISETKEKLIKTWVKEKE